MESGDTRIMTRLFNRKDKTTIAELEEYYSSTGKKNRSGMAWLMAFLSLALTIIIIVAIFLLGRWIYRAVTDDNSSTTISENEGESIELPNFDGDIVGQGNQNSSSETETGTATEPETEGVVSDEAASITVDDNQNTDSNVSGTSTSTPNSVGGEGSDIPNTGAEELVILIPIATGVAGYFISRKYQLNQK